MITRNNYDEAPEYKAAAYAVSGWGKGIAFYVIGWETEPDEDTEWTGFENRTGNLIVRMVGDDRNFSADPDDVAAIEPTEFCRSCGQVGCTHNVYE